ncbi:TPA: hypothetical protein ACH3X1_006836 [Trebouxia sp. C0004]
MRLPAKKHKAGGSTSSQPAVISPRKITSFVDRVKVTAAQQRHFSTLLCIAFVTCGWSFRTVENPEFKVSYRTCGPITSCPVQIHWLALCLYHLTLTLDGWSNDRVESIYSWNIIFPNRRVILLKADDLSSMAHTGENLAPLIIKEIERWGANRFAAILKHEFWSQ